MSNADNSSLHISLLRGNANILTRQIANFMLVAEDIETMGDRLKDQLDSMHEMGEMETMVLQMRTDRLQKALSTLSSIMRRLEETNQAVINNIK